MAGGPERWRKILSERNIKPIDSTYRVTETEDIKNIPGVKARFVIVDEGDSSGIDAGFYLETNILFEELYKMRKRGGELLLEKMESYILSILARPPIAHIPGTASVDNFMSVSPLKGRGGITVLAIEPVLPSGVASAISYLRRGFSEEFSKISAN